MSIRVYQGPHSDGRRLPVSWQWLPWREAADLCFSASNAEACLWLPRFAAQVR